MTSPAPRQGEGVAEAVEHLTAIAKSFGDREVTSVHLPGALALKTSKAISAALAALSSQAEALERTEKSRRRYAKAFGQSVRDHLATSAQLAEARTALSQHRQKKEDPA